MTIPAMILKMFELNKKNFPIKEAVEKVLLEKQSYKITDLPPKDTYEQDFFEEPQMEKIT